ncbi:MAG: AraC family transcriptional regulator [Lachnospiraceae bacterium]|nr:AraC family transcriptional regulator [Lachnospiraceae bacterium]
MNGVQHYPVQEISELLHFSSPSYFCEHFRKINGISPNQFRTNKS